MLNISRFARMRSPTRCIILLYLMVHGGVERRSEEEGSGENSRWWELNLFGRHIAPLQRDATLVGRVLIMQPGPEWPVGGGWWWWWWWGAKGMHGTQDSCLTSWAPKGPIQRYQSLILGELFSQVINRSHKANFSSTMWENIRRPCSCTGSLLPGASQSGGRPSSGPAAGCVHGRTVGSRK